MKKRMTLFAAALALLLTACNGSVEENAPPAETATPAPAVSPAVSPSVTADPEPVPPSPSVFVYTDWSKLDQREETRASYTRYYEGFMDFLIPVDGGYGSRLMSFPGETMELDFWGWPEYRYGLATADGTVVCDPVYDSVYHPSFYDWERGEYVDNGEFLILDRTLVEESNDPEQYPDAERVLTVAAGDGSWVLEEEYRHCFTLSDGRLFLIDREEGLWLCGQDGTLERSPLPEKPSALWGDWWWEMGGFADGVACINTFDPNTGKSTGYCLANAVTGEIIPLPDISICYGWYFTPDSWAEAQDGRTNLWGYLDRNGEWAIPPQFSGINRFEEGFACVTLVSGERAVIDRSGNVMLEVQGDTIRPFLGGYGSNCYLVLAERDMEYVVTGVYDQNFRFIPDHPIVGRVLENQFSNGAPATREGNAWTLWDQEGAVCTVEVDAYLDWELEGGLLQFRSEDGAHGLYDPAAGKWVVPMDAGYTYIYPCSGLEKVVYRADLSANSSSAEKCDLLDADGTRIARVDYVFGSGDGLICVRDGGYSGFLDLEGNWVFRWPIQSNSD